LDKGLGPIRYALCPGHTGAVGAAVDGAVGLNAVADNPATAMLASRGECMNCTLEAVEHVWLVPWHGHLEGLVVLISTHLTLGHLNSPFSKRDDSPSLK
jgi:hypothetical protein